MIARRFGPLALTIGLGACALDDRQLLAARVDHIAGGGESGADGLGSGGGAGPEPGSATDLVGGCADLDTDGVGDCQVTLVENPSFASDADGWTPLGDAGLAWDPKNALSDAHSGSAKLTADVARASAFQCVKLSGAHLVIAYASAFVEADPDQDPSQAELEVWFFEGDDCSGVTDGYFETPPSTVLGQWATIQAGGVSSGATSSVSIALVGVKADAASELNVYFDNVMLEAKAP